MPEKRFISVTIITLPKENKIKVGKTVIYKDVAVPVGYISDGLTKLVNKYAPNCIRAAVVHDYVCSEKILPRKTGDKYFLEILELDGVAKWKRYGMYWAVRSYAIATFKK